MATLTETAQAMNKIGKISLVLLAAFFGFKLLSFIFNTYLTVAKPAPVSPPTASFGKLPAIEFPQKLNPELTLRLETPTGGTPNLGDRADVYLMPMARSNFLALDAAKTTAQKIGFSAPPKELTPRRYRFETEDFLPGALEIDIVSGAFTLKRNWQSDPTILADKQLPGKDQAIMSAKSFLSTAGLLNDELSNSRMEVSYLVFSGGQYQKAASLSEADFVQVDIFRPNINDRPVLPQIPAQGIVRIIFSGSAEAGKQIIQVDYHYIPVNLNESATYPIKATSQAWRELQTRQGFIASIGTNSGGVVSIRKIYLAYYDPDESQGYLLPIIIFEGDGGFFGYVPAVTNDWLETPPTYGSPIPSQSE